MNILGGLKVRTSDAGAGLKAARRLFHPDSIPKDMTPEDWASLGRSILTRTPRDRLSAPGVNPVKLIVHGVGCSAGVMELLGNEFPDDVDIAYVYLPPFGIGRIRDNVSIIKRKLAELDSMGYEIGVLGHSMGGLVGVLGAAKSAVDVSSVDVIAAPFKGADLARMTRIVAPFLPIGRDLEPGSEELTRLLEIELNEVRVRIFVTTEDRVVHPDKQLPHPRLSKQMSVEEIRAGHHDRLLTRAGRKEMVNDLMAA